MARKKKDRQQEKQTKKQEEEAAPEMDPIDSDDDAVDSGSEEGSGSGEGEEGEEGEEEDDEEEYDSAAEQDNDNDDPDDDDPYVSDDYQDSDDDDDGEGFEDQGSSSEDDDDDDESDDDVEVIDEAIDVDAPRSWPGARGKRGTDGAGVKKAGSAGSAATKTTTTKASSAADVPAEGATSAVETAEWIHADDLSSDDDDPDGTSNRIGRVPLHWYDDFEHVGYTAGGERVVKSSASFASKDLLDRAIDAADESENRFAVHDALNARDVALTPRQVELIRRLQSGAFAHPEHDANPDYVDYFSGVDPMKSGLNSDRYEKKSRFQPSKWEKLQVRRLLHRLKCGSINMDYLEGKVRDMNDLIKREDDEGKDGRPFMLWRGDEEDELALRKGPQHVPAPKVPPPGHAMSYNPPEEYLPNEEEIKEWAEMDPEDRPYGHFIPQKFDNLRSVGAYEHAVKERFERCLDLYLCPRAMKRRLNIDPESLVPRLPRASDLRPFPTTKCVRYVVPGLEESDAVVAVRCLAVSPDGQFLASGGEDGVARLWEVQTGRLLTSWDLNQIVAEKVTGGGMKDGESGGGGGDAPSKDEEDKSRKDELKKLLPIASIEWNPNRSHHVLLAAIGSCIVVLSTGTAGPDDAEVTDALLSAASSCKNGGNIPKDSRAASAVSWTSVTKRGSSTKPSQPPPVSAYGGKSGPIAYLRTTADVTSIKWHRKGDYFATVSPKATGSGSGSAVLVHQLSRAASQQPFGKSFKGEAQLACFHPTKPFLFVATKEHVRVYHLVERRMVKKLASGCRHISSIDVHGSGDHVVVGSLDRRLAWFDLDLASTPYKTLKYHERALRSVGFHPRYPLMASASDDGTVHVFHSMVYSDLMRNPLIVPVKVLRAHSVTGGLGALAMAFHPTQPWLFSAGADGNIHLFQDL